MTWTRIYGPDSNYNQCGDDALYEVGSIYGEGTPNAEGFCRQETEIVYYVVFTPGHPTANEDSWGVMCQTNTYARDENDQPSNEDYNYEWGSHLCFWSYEDAKTEADALAAKDETYWLNFCTTLEELAS